MASIERKRNARRVRQLRRKTIHSFGSLLRRFLHVVQNEKLAARERLDGVSAAVGATEFDQHCIGNQRLNDRADLPRERDPPTAGIRAMHRL